MENVEADYVPGLQFGARRRRRVTYLTLRVM